MEQENKITKSAGRPFKMEKWLGELKTVLENENISFLTDTDLQFLVNRNLAVEDRITSRTFENWKAGKFSPDEEMGREFMEVLQYALLKQKQALGEKLMSDTSSQWTRWAWILERKYSDLNLKKISEKITRQEQSLTLNITAGDTQQLDLINQIVNSDFASYQAVEPLKIDVQCTDNKKEDDMPF